MKRIFTAVAIAICLLAATGYAADKKKEKKGPEAPAFPGQDEINGALKQLTAAQASLNGGGSKAADTVAYLKKAEGHLVKLAKNKGSFRATSLRLTEQAVKHLEKQDTETAAHEIDEAIKAVIEGGKMGDKHKVGQ